jgi:hypothetical protein
MRYVLRRVGKHFYLRWGQLLGREECPYAKRWALGLGLFSLRVHHFYRSDDDRAHHDHPWWFLTLVLRGSYVDESPCPICVEQGVPRSPYHPYCICRGTGVIKDTLTPGSIRFRRAHHKHTVRTTGVWTLVLTGPHVRTWGFWDRGRFVKSNKWFLTRGHHPCDQP